MKTDPEAAAADIGKTLLLVAEFKRREKLRRQWLLVGAVAMAILLVVVVVDWFAAWQSGWGRWLGLLAVLAGCGFFLWRTIQTHLSKADQAGAARRPRPDEQGKPATAGRPSGRCFPEAREPRGRARWHRH